MEDLVQVFIISSLTHPIYQKVNKLRTRLLEYYKIPYVTLLNDNEETNNSSTFTPLQKNEIMYPKGGYTPHMTLKFIQSVKYLFLFKKSPPKYIVRINATTYVHFPSMIQFLKTLPEEKILAGLQFDWGVSGMCMIFSSDVLKKVLNDPKIYDKNILNQPDDVALSQIAEPYSQIKGINQVFVFPPEGTDDNNIYNPTKIKHDKWIFRIRNESFHDRRIDLQNWDILMNHFSERKIIKKNPRQFNLIFLTVAILLCFFTVITIMLIYRTGRRP